MASPQQPRWPVCAERAMHVLAICPCSRRKLFEASGGNGGTARLVMLPFESHGYRAMASTEHVIYEMLAWFDKYVKNAPPRGTAAADQAK
jgi:hypothetical protein